MKRREFIKAGIVGEIGFARSWYQNARKPLVKGDYLGRAERGQISEAE